MNYKTIIINTDGGARGNPGPAGIGAVAVSGNQTVFTISQYIGHTTNNVAEYTAVIKALEYLIQKKIKAQKINFILDSELIVKQLIGQYKIKQPHLQQLAIKVKTLIADVRKLIIEVQFSHVKRDKNKQADQLVNQAIDRFQNSSHPH